MKTLPLGLSVMFAMALMGAGCSSGRRPKISTPPVVFEKTIFDTPLLTKQQVTASARYVRVPGKLPEAKEALAFLADEAGLRQGTVTLTQKQAEAALVELRRVTNQDVRSTPRVPVAEGNPAKIICGALTPSEEDAVAAVRVTVGGIEQASRAREVGVSLRITPQVLDDGGVEMDAEIQVTAFEGFIEYGGKPGGIPAKISPWSEVTKTAGVKVPDKFYQPIFSTSSVQRELRIAKGAVVVLLAEPVKNYASSKEGMAKGLEVPLLGRLNSQLETWLVFLTAAVEPAKR
ncbi:MAG: hypothetical protein WC661_17110 [Opitutaceae bacterium]|jgi:hypothetical protein